MRITDTGTRGFLKWMRQEYPPALYAKMAQQIQQQIPQAFSGYMLGAWRGLARLNGFADSSGTATVDTADAANSSAMDPGWAADISQIIGTSSAAFTNVEQALNQQKIVNTQLQQAQAGKTPLPITLSSSGITFGSAGWTVGSLTVIAIVGYFGLKAVGVLKK